MISKMLATILLWALTVKSSINPHELNEKDKEIEEEKGDIYVKFIKSGKFNIVMIIASSIIFAFQLYIVTPWTKLEVIWYSMSICCLLIRIWAINELDVFFTFQPAIRENHKIIKSGPYRYLVHPSYTGLIGSTIFTTFFFANNSWVSFYKIVSGHSTDAVSIFVGLFAGILLLYFFSKIYNGSVFILKRIGYEEKGLCEKFGAEFDEYVNTRYRLVPFIY